MKYTSPQNRYLSFSKAAQKVFLIALLLLNFIGAQKVNAQGCLVSSLNISTGYDPTTSTFPYVAGVHDPKWVFSGGSTDLMSSLSFYGYTPGAWDVGTDGCCWATCSGGGGFAQWINCADVYNPLMYVGSYVYTMTFSRSFSLCCSTNVCLNLSFAGDDIITNINVDGGASLYSSGTGSYSPCVGLPNPCMALSAGTHTLNITISCDATASPNPNGLCVYGTVTTATPEIISESTACSGYACTLPPILGNDYVCLGDCTTLSDVQTGGIWSSSNTSVVTIGSTSGVACGASVGVATITYTVGCLQATTSFTVAPIPTLNITPLCVGSDETITVIPAGAGTWTSSNTGVAMVGYTTGIAFGVGAGMAVIDYTSFFGCEVGAIITVNPSPGPIYGTFWVCPGGTTQLYDGTTGGTWSIGGGTGTASITSGGLVTGGSTLGTTTVTYTSGGCSATQVITIGVVPAISGPTSVCTGSSITLNDALTGGTWSSSNTSVAAFVSGAGVLSSYTAGTTIITYTMSTGCYVTTTVTVYATPTPIAGVTTLCVGGTTSLSDNITGGVWSSSNTGVATIDASLGTVAGVSTGTTIITYMLPGGCFATTIVTVITTPPAPTITPIAPDVYGGCNVALTGSPGIGGADDITSLLWTEVNGTGTATLSSYTTTNTTLTGGSPGNVTVSYTVTNICGSATTTTNVTVLAPPVITITSDPPPTDFVLCVGQGGVATASPAGGTWSSGNTSVVTVVGTSPAVITGVGAGITALTYTLSLGGGCTETAILPVTINPTPATITGIMELCVGVTTTLHDATGGGVWSSDDIYVATVGAGSGIVTGVSTGIADISYTLTTGCMTTATVTVDNPAISGTPMLCVGNSATFTDAMSDGTWSSTNTTVATVTTSGVVMGVSAGTAVISYLSAAGCIGTFTVTVIDATSACVCYFVSTGGVVTELDPTGSGVLAAGTYSGSYYLTHSVVINGNVQFVDAVVDMASGISVTVNSGGYLTVEGSHFYCCNPNMWQGIILSTTLSTGGTGPTGQLEMDADPNGITSMIEDAQIAVNIPAPVHIIPDVPGTPTNLILYSHGATLNKNVIGISITGDLSTTAPVSGDPLVLNPSYPYVVENTVITSRDFYGYTTGIGIASAWPFVWPTTSLLKTPITPATPYQPPYKINTAFTYSFCNSGTAPQKAIDVESTGYTNPGSGAGTEVYSGVVIGGASTGVLATDMNLIDKYLFGIYDVNSNVVSRNTAFMNIAPNGLSGDGIYANRTAAAAAAGKLYKLDVFGTSPGTTPAQYLAGYNNKFWSNYVHVYAHDLYNVRGIYSLMNGLSNVKTQYGYQLSSSQYYDIKINYNMMFNLLYGISHTVLSPVATQLIGETSMTYNQISNANPPALTPTYGEYVAKAISVQNLLAGAGSMVFGSEVNIDYNTLAYVYNGIYVQGNNSMQITTTYSNTVTVHRDASGPALQVGIEHVNMIGDWIDENTVTGPGYNTPLPSIGHYTLSPVMEGIHVETSQKLHAECNTVSDINTGFYFGGYNTSIDWRDNKMTRNTFGYVIDGVIGSQPGSAAGTTGNQWLPSGFWTGTTKMQTYVIGTTTSPSLSWMYVQGGVQQPTNNSFDFGCTAYLLGAGITVTVSAAVACSAPPSSTVPELFIPVKAATTQLGYTAPTASSMNWIAQMSTYRLMTADTTLDTNTVLSSFHAMANTSRYQYICNVETNVANAGYTNATALLGYPLSYMANADSDSTTGVVMADSTVDHVVSNYKLYYGLLVKYMTDTLSSADSASVVALANLCPYVDGSVVYQARALYSLIYNDLQTFADAGCGGGSNGMGDRLVANPSVGSDSMSGQHYILYPNPSNGNVTLQQLVPDADPVNAEVLNATGTRVYAGRLYFEDGVAQFSMGAKAPGLYLLQLNDSKGRSFSLKFVIQ